jgi:hypothetical protein
MSFGIAETSVFFLLPILSVLVSTAVMILAAVAAWRIMKAQEAAARSLQQIARDISSRSI